VRAALKTFGLRLRPARGQHFLIDRAVLDRIIEAADAGPDDVVLEVGAGIGTLTVALARTGARVIALEVDARFVPVARAACGRYPRVRLVHADAMTLDLARLPEPPTKVVANLPYSIASPLLIDLLAAGVGRRLVVMVQREVGDRIVARPGTSAYGLLTVAIQARATASIEARVSRGAFFPPPQVASCVVRLDVPASPPVALERMPAFMRVVRAAFGQRRKMLRSALRAMEGRRLSVDQVEAVCRAAGVDPRRRGESLNVAEFARLAEAAESIGSPPDRG
jgi:16S rRNA (adenine1518-N6/adenine1519-N6)-dimethyltransferase